MFGFCNVWVCVCLGFVMCGYFGNCMGVFVLCVLVFIAFCIVLYRLCICILICFVCINATTTAAE
jgi:hypothetical protein